MIELKVASREAILAVREAQQIVKGKAEDASEGSTVRPLGRRMGRGLLAVAFLVLCFLPPLTALLLVVLAILMAR